MFDNLRAIAASAGLAVSTLTGVASAQIGDYDFGYYDYYDAGFNGDFNDDWFYDYYDWGDHDDTYDFYSDYNYDTDLFDWEEDGLFQ